MENTVVKKNQKRNFIAFFLENILVCNAMIFVGAWSIVPFFFSNLGASTFQVGLINATLNYTAFLSIPIFAYFSTKSAIKSKSLAKMAFTGRLIFLLTMLAMPSLIKVSATLAITVFLVAWFIFYFLLNGADPFYFPCLSKVLPSTLHGRVYGIGSTIGNIIGLGSSALVGVLISNFEFPTNYIIILVIGTIIYLLDACTYVAVKEEPESSEASNISFIQYLKNLLHEARSNKSLQILVLGYVLSLIPSINLGYYSLFAIRQYEADDAAVAIFATVLLIAPMIAATLFGVINDKIGIKVSHSIMALFGILGSAIALLVPNILGVYVACLFTRMAFSGNFCNSNISICKVTSQERQPLAIAVNGIIVNVVLAITGILGAFIIDNTSFEILFIITGISGVAALILFLTIPKNLGKIN